MHLVRTLSRLRVALAAAVLLAMLVPQTAFGVSRSAVIARGKVWVGKKVPYSQSRYARTDGSMVPTSTVNPQNVGWRTDCSGFLSMCFGITRTDGKPYSLDTASLPYRATKISRAELRPGDFILRPKNLVINGKQVPYGHAVLFVRWVDASKTKYVGYHESSSGRGTVAAEITYPFWGEAGFAPYRYKQIEDSRMRKSLTWYSPLSGSAVSTGSLLPTATAPLTIAPVPPPGL